MKIGLTQATAQKLVFTQELRASVNILQYSAHELIEYLQQQANDNPFIEIDEQACRGIGSAAAVTPERPSLDGDTDYIRSEPKSYLETSSWMESISDAERFTMENELNQQLGYIPGLSMKEREIARYLIGNLDDKGYLDISIEEAAHGLNLRAEEIEHALHIVQQLEPAGIGARNLQECLVLQLSRSGILNPLAYQIIEHHLDDLACHRYQKVASSLHTDVQELKSMLDLIRSLNPKPGTVFHQEAPQYIVPDVKVEKLGSEYVVSVNDHALPKVTMHACYEQLSRQSMKQLKDKQIFHEKYNEVKWLVRSLKQRSQTLYRVSSAIMDSQRSFLDDGVEHIRPLTLKQIAQQLEMHESTISRATTRKYIQTPRGVFELKYFFSTGLASGGEGSVSSESVKSKIKQLIQQEDKRKPLSDQAMTRMLNQQGIDISRRTVAKYREELGIVSSSMRKEL
ncbi:MULTISPECIES: RNA polymerase factor sigma-54 [unclassified Paenibacillus]|uniref:RNA polymerase factor sigma-54 n=1 Tax=unclassified Paenibacillus TaxID=185978 RepID=UPI001AE2BFB4|nr:MULTISPECIES: RNA polymerase factor sigma-54 [unclassified Paenibacillus]MBP1153709.1 RNA polymerase sigma-54 factor [Paenibacillus sp. PvP091]MBP1170906.1 RNA polymerase sigma-54 factor [Paenibacillus sp. PvR098]MBP2441934.1 RNA polymerase sigma-54 factor [Paenibacillus sp. PvP052]